MSSTYKIFVDKMGGHPAANYIGLTGELFYDPADGAIRVSNGITPGGTPINTPTSAVAYRGFYASYGSFFGDDPSVNQIIISRNQGMLVTYDSSDTDNDDLHARNLAGSSHVIVLNLYGNDSNKGLNAPTVSRFVKAFIDDVCYAGNNSANPLTTVSDLKYWFYLKIDQLIADHLPEQSLYQNFEFYSNNYWHGYTTVPNPRGGSNAVLSFYADSQIGGFPYVADGVSSGGSNFIIGDQITVSATEFGLEPVTNDAVFTVTNVDGNGAITDYAVGGSGIEHRWYNNNISDGGNDQYDSGNYLNTNVGIEIPYHSGIPVYSSPLVGGGDYVVTYKNSVFAFFITNANITDFYFTGNMGADGNGNKVNSALFGHESVQNTEYVDQNNNLVVADSSEQLVNVSGGNSHNIPNFSGMLLVNDHYDGAVELWICGGNYAVLINSTHPNATGSMSIDGSINGYVWTNSSNMNGPFTFTVVKTRYGA